MRHNNLASARVSFFFLCIRLSAFSKETRILETVDGQTLHLGFNGLMALSHPVDPLFERIRRFPTDPTLEEGEPSVAHFRSLHLTVFISFHICECTSEMQPVSSPEEQVCSTCVSFGFFAERLFGERHAQRLQCDPSFQRGHITPGRGGRVKTN